MTSVVKIVYCLDGSNIKDDVVKRTKEGSDGIKEVRTYSLDERLGLSSQNDNEVVNILIVTPAMCGEVAKHADQDFRVLFPNMDKALILVCDTESERTVSSVLSKSVDYSNICKFHSSNAMEWKYIMVPTIKKMASMETEEPSIPDINRYVIKPNIIDSSIDEVCIVFLNGIGQNRAVKVFIDDNIVTTSRLSKGVYVFSPQGISSGIHAIKVSVEDENYGSTPLEVQGDLDKLKTFFQKTVHCDPLTVLGLLLGSETTDKEDIESELIDILQSHENSFNATCMTLLENVLRLEPTVGNDTNCCYPSLLHFCAANGLSRVSEWLLYNSPEDKRNWTNKEGLTPAQLAGRENYNDLRELLNPEKPIGAPPVGQRVFLPDENEEETVFLPSPIATEQRRTSVQSSFHTDPGRDSGRSSYSSAGESNASIKKNRHMSTGNLNFKTFSKGDRHYDIIDDKVRQSQTHMDSNFTKKFNFKKKAHTYSEIEDLDMEPGVKLRPERDPPYEEAWENNPIPDNIPIKPTSKQTPDSDLPIQGSSSLPRGNKTKLQTLPRGRSLDGMGSATRL